VYTDVLATRMARVRKRVLRVFKLYRRIAEMLDNVPGVQQGVVAAERVTEMTSANVGMEKKNNSKKSGLFSRLLGSRKGPSKKK